VLHTLLRVCGFVGGVCLLAISAGCAGSSSHQSDSAARTGAAQYAARLMTGGAGHTSIGGVGIDWQHEHDGHVCYTAKLPGHGADSSVGSCIRRLRANQITFQISRVLKTHQLVIVGVQGPRVEKVYLRFRDKRWTPPTSQVAFFGYVPRGKVLSVVKVLKNGTRREFAVNQYSA
jgi:hypothetical protein